ncbi:serine hydrolase [Brevundimonas sp.]|uniref:serine hydrolase domain-containing protein n=1 Tax=Brevundimonas sp. TaxID=1871086 RepID=UPI002488811D|nr:serine hydrolase [Brevundimonas sp.]MDI1279969.1 serine hydrolase [Brevundimonas sp.]
MRTLILAATLAVAPLAAPALAQTVAPASAEARASAAGYKALTLCSAVHNATAAGGQRSPDSVDANEFVGIYPTLDPLIHDLTATFTGHRVSVAWDETGPPRVAVWRPGGGCSIMPVGWTGPAGVPATAPTPSVPPVADLPSGPAAGDAVALAAAVTGASDGRYGGGTNTTAVVVLQGGTIVSESYAPGFGPDVPQRTWSVAKSLAGTLIGAAVQRGEVDVDAPAAIANWQVDGDPRRVITLDQLMRMASGLTSDSAGNRTDALYFGGTTVEEQVPGWPLIAVPGARFRYANNDILLAVLAIAPTFAAHPPADLFARLGMTDTVAETDWRGHYILSSQVWSTARDLARFGRLYLNDGVHDGQRILPEGWLAHVSRPSGPQPEGDFGYGATFWLMNRSDGVPADTIAAFGNRGQYVVIVPARNIVIVRRGEDPTGNRFDMAAFTRDVLAALDQ